MELRDQKRCGVKSLVEERPEDQKNIQTYLSYPADALVKQSNNYFLKALAGRLAERQERINKNTKNPRKWIFSFSTLAIVLFSIDGINVSIDVHYADIVRLEGNKGERQRFEDSPTERGESSRGQELQHSPTTRCERGTSHQVCRQADTVPDVQRRSAAHGDGVVRIH